MKNSHSIGRIGRQVIASGLLCLSAIDAAHAQTPRIAESGVEIFGIAGSLLPNKIRRASGTYSTLQDVTKFTGALGPLADVSAAATRGCELEIVAVDAAGGLKHAIRRENSATGLTSFSAFGDIKGATYSDPGPVLKACATGGDELFVVAVAKSGYLHVATRYPSTHWSRMEHVPYAAAQYRDVDCSFDEGTKSLHVAAITTYGDVHHTMRDQYGRWQVGMGVVRTVAGFWGVTTDVAVSADRGNLHVVAVSNGRVYHTIRNQSGGWQPYGDVTAATGLTSAIASVATSMSPEGLNVTVRKTTRAVLNGARRSDGTWRRFTAAGSSWSTSAIATARYSSCRLY